MLAKLIPVFFKKVELFLHAIKILLYALFFSAISTK